MPHVFDVRYGKDATSLAVTDGTQSLRYGELEAASTSLANQLRRLGAGRDSVVGLYAPRSVAQIVAALGIMKAGAAFLPLDPTLPKERVAFMLADAGVEILASAASVRSEARALCARVVSVEEDGQPSAEPVSDVFERVAPAEPGPEDLAYVIYTSGSTGRPKGVEITHRGLSNLVSWHRTAFGVGSSDRASYLSYVGFDAAVWEVWPYLAAGASLHIASDAVAKDAEALRDWLVARRITLAFASTPLLERMLDLEWPAATALRTLLTGGDTLRKYPPRGLPFQVVNNYGPTEAAVVATSGIVSPADTFERLPPLGRPIANAHVYLVDERLRLVPDGDEGEICIGGAGLARGYRGRPELTAERFVASPLAAGTHARIYRTGDRGRRLPDGQLAFLGRFDEQLKIRGVRIEAGEVEAVLDSHPEVRESVAVVREFAPGDSRLVAFVVAAKATHPKAARLREFLATRLPGSMVPSNIVFLSSLPLTANGKFDRAALRARELEAPAPGADYVAPRTPTEVRVTQILEPLLKMDVVSVEDNFFTLGGHSLLGTQLIARIRDAFGVKIGLRYLFESPTIAALAREIERLTFARPQTTSGGSAAIPKRL